MDRERANDDPRASGARGRQSPTERRILDSAAELIREGGLWHTLGIRQIAERAELSRTAFYDFFASKDELLAQLVTESHDELSRLLARRPDGTKGIPPDLAEPEPMLRALAEFCLQHGPIYLAFLAASIEDPRLDRLWRGFIEHHVAVIARAIDRARAAVPTVPQELPSRDIAEALVLMTERSFVRWLRPNQPELRIEPRIAAMGHVWRVSVFGPDAPG